MTTVPRRRFLHHGSAVVRDATPAAPRRPSLDEMNRAYRAFWEGRGWRKPASFLNCGGCCGWEGG